ncbi:MAG: SpoIIE family protein phosphatase [Cyanobacteria bacterium]|nr:SpoIIE family protein phosphatase [Cyanobacteriota bacterium]
MNESDQPKLKLMVVDDEQDNLDLLYRTFRREFSVYRADSGFSALDLLDREGEMAIIISDQRMPGMNGTELLSKTVDRFPDTIRIILTGYTDVEDLVGAINSGKVFKYITKPWNPDKLKSTVAQASDTYRVLKRRTDELNRALRRESLFNDMMSAIRKSLDYDSMLGTIAKTIGQNFQLSRCILHPVEGDRLRPQSFVYDPTADGVHIATDSPAPDLANALAQGSPVPVCDGQLTLPLVYQQDCLALLVATVPGDGWVEDDTKLMTEVAEQAALALSQARLYQRSEAQTAQLLQELELARQVQSNLLRQSWPQSDRANVQACCQPAREVGGDFFEVYLHPKGDIWLAVGDVSGKGVPAALFMASAISVLRQALAQADSPAPDEVMAQLNSSLSENLIESNRFITLALARYTPSTGRLAYANAGHIYPMVWSHRAVANAAPGTVEPTYLKARGVPLGILPVWKAKAGEVDLAAGDVLLLASDGITEATVEGLEGLAEQPAEGETGVMLRQEGLWTLLERQGQPLDLDALLAELHRYAQEQEDDQTMLSLEVLEV